MVVMKTEKTSDDSNDEIDEDIIQTEITLEKTPRTELKKHQNNIKEVIINSNATPIRRYGGIGYTCSYCKDQFVDPADLKKHSIEKHKDINEAHFMKQMNMSEYVVKLDITGLKCKICDTNMSTLDVFIEHLQKVHGSKFYTDIKNRIFPLKLGTDLLICVFCSNTFSKFRMLVRHMHIHYRNYICSVCDSGFVNRNALTQHAKNHKTGSFVCDYCPKIFSTQVKKRLHERTSHTHVDKGNKCAYCEETFKDYRKKEIHLAAAHGVESLTPVCQACNKVFNNRKSLGIHMKRDHLMERTQKCSECDMKFFSATQLKNHMVKHTGLKEHQCKTCLKCFGRRKTLNAHMRTHEERQRYKCERCGQDFCNKWTWKAHMKSKHEESL